MGRSVLLVALLALVANVSFSQAQTVNKYFKVGSTLQLSPQSVSAPITSVVWKYDKNLLAEWVKGSIPLTYYSRFNGRTTLNTDTGVLDIGATTAADTALYSVEINNQVQSRVYQTVEIEDVPQPGVEAKPLACSSASESCKLVCEGNVSKAGPVEYFWKKDDGEWEKSAKDTVDIINNAETQSVEKIYCRMKNPVSEKDSNPLENVFYREPEPSSSVGPIVGGVVGVFGFLSVAVLGFLGYKNKERIRDFFEGRGRQPVPSTDNGTDKNELGSVTTPQPASA